jgi:hypothetical protein
MPFLLWHHVQCAVDDSAQVLSDSGVRVGRIGLRSQMEMEIEHRRTPRSRVRPRRGRRDGGDGLEKFAAVIGCFR